MVELFIENISLKSLNVKNAELAEEVSNNSDILVFYAVPVWSLKERNINGKIYTTELGERLIATKAIIYKYWNHPDEVYTQSFNSVKNITKKTKSN